MKQFNVTPQKKMLSGLALFLSGIVLMLVGFSGTPVALFIAGLAISVLGGWAFAGSLEEV